MLKDKDIESLITRDYSSFLGTPFLDSKPECIIPSDVRICSDNCDVVLWTASQVIADSSASLVRLTRPRESSPLLITLLLSSSTRRRFFTLSDILDKPWSRSHVVTGTSYDV